MDLPITRESLAGDLRRLGVRPGSALLVHSSLRALGWVVGGPVAVTHALLDALEPAGTLVVPTHTPENSEPSRWRHPPVPEPWWPVIRAQMPGFDPAVTPSRWMGALPEVVRAWPGARRSDHPQVSFAAVGPAAAAIVDDHPRAAMLGERSPIGRLHELDGDVLLLGVGHESNTSLHLAEYRQPDPPRQEEGAAVLGPDGAAQWVTWSEVAVDESDFDLLGRDLDAAGLVRVGTVGAATARLMRQRPAVEFAVDWISRRRSR